MRVLVTRPESDGPRTAAAIAARGHTAVLAPLLVVRALPTPDPDPRAASIAATSANAFRAAPGGLTAPWRDRPCFVVGAATAAAARAAGHRRVIEGSGDGAALAATVAATIPRDAALLYLAGRPRRPDFETGLAAAGVDVRVLELYETLPVEWLPPALAEGLASRSLDVATHFSPRSAAVFAKLVTEADLTEAARSLRHLCLSAAVAAELATLGCRAVEVPARPSLDALLDMLDR